MGSDLRNNGLFIETGDPSGTNESSTSPFIPGQIGHVMARVDTTQPKLPGLYQYVTRSSGDASTAYAGGAVAVWKDFDDFVVTGEDSDAFSGSGLNLVAGVFLSSTHPGTSANGYIQVGGIANLAYADATSVGLSPTSGGLPVYAIVDGTSAVYGAVWPGWWYVSSSASTVGLPSQVFAKCIETVATVATAGYGQGDVILLIDRIGW